MLNLEKIIALIILIICIVYAYTSFVIMQANLLPFELNMTVLPNSLPKVISIFGIVISLFLILKKDEETIGELFSFFVLETILLARLMKVNPFDQPSVELIKTETSKKLI